MLAGARRHNAQELRRLEKEQLTFWTSLFGGQDSVTNLLKPEEAKVKAEEAWVCNNILKMFHSGVILMDEVDLLMDPRKSELNWPLGRQLPIDLTEARGAADSAKEHEGLRYKLPFHILDGLFAAMGENLVVPFQDSEQALRSLAALRAVIEKGRSACKLQTVPHLVVLSTSFYFEEMLPSLAEWSAFFLDRFVGGCFTDAQVREALKCVGNLDDNWRHKLERAKDVFVKLLNLARDWLHSLLPHVLSRVHRVSYGLLTGAPALGHQVSKSRRHLAVPFVGKDRPSAQSEFQHPDVLIGFTILAYRLHGMRRSDLHTLIRSLQADMRSESTLRFHRRRACKEYVTAVLKAGRTVRGFTEDGRWTEDLTRKEQTRRLNNSGNVLPKGEFMETLWPLEVVDLQDDDQMDVLYGVLRKSPPAIQLLLDQSIFTPSKNIISCSMSQLTASGQDLAGPQLCGFCLGFSGTPNNLLPRVMGECMFEAGDDGAILRVLGDTRVVSAKALDAWDPQTLLNIVAGARASDGSGPKYHTLIDTGALITGMSNFEVALYLLRNGLVGFDGIVYLDKADERMVLVRDGLRIVKLSQCGLAPEKRFTFYDHVHTTGMDIRQPVSCVACLTLSKDMTFRDYAQGAYRMRLIGKGQRIEVLLIPEVASLLHESMGKVEGITEDCHRARLVELEAGSPAWTQSVIVDIISWLTLNGITADEKK